MGGTIDFSAIGGKKVKPSKLDFSSIGGRPVEEAKVATEPQDPGIISGITSAIGEQAKAFGQELKTPANYIPVYGPGRLLYKGLVEPQIPLVKRAAKETWESVKHPLTPPLPLTGLHRAEALLPGVGPMIANVEETSMAGKPREAIGRGMVYGAELAAPFVAGKTWKATAKGRAAVAERAEQSVLGPEPKNIFEVSRPAPALVKEGLVAATTKGLLSKVEARISSYGAVVRNTLGRVRTLPPEPLAPIVERATQPIIDLARSNGYETIAKGIEKWKNDYLTQHPASVTLDQLYKLKSDMGKAGKAFKGGPAEDVGVKEVTQQFVTEANRTIGQRIPGLRDITQRESGLINAADMLRNKARIEAGGPMLLPGARIFGGLTGESGGLGASGRLGLPGGTLAKTALAKALGKRAPLPLPTIPQTQSGAQPTPPSTIQNSPATPATPQPIGLEAPPEAGSLPPVPKPTSAPTEAPSSPQTPEQAPKAAKPAYDRRFDIRLRQDVKDWAKSQGISEEDALQDVLEQRSGSAEAERATPPVPVVGIDIDFLKSRGLTVDQFRRLSPAAQAKLRMEWKRRL